MDVKERAAVVIQSLYRGHIGRKKFCELLREQFERVSTVLS